MNMTAKFSRYLQKNKYKVHLEVPTPNPDITPTSTPSPIKSKEYAKLSKQIYNHIRKMINDVSIMRKEMQHAEEALKTTEEVSKIEEYCMRFLKEGEKQIEKLKEVIIYENRAQLPNREYNLSEIHHQSSIIMCLKNTLEQLAIKYREYKAVHNRKLYQEMRNKLLKEEAFHETEKALLAGKKPTFPQETVTSKPADLDTAKALPTHKPPISEKEKKSIEDESVMLQKLISSDLEIIKQAHNRMVEISMLIRQFSVKAFEQQQLTELSKPFTINMCVVLKDTENSVKNIQAANKELNEAKKYQSTWAKIWVIVYVFMGVSVLFLDRVNTDYY